MTAPRILHLEGVPRGAELQLALGGRSCRAGTALEAAALLGQQVDAIVVGEAAAWALSLVSALPLETRPAVLGVGRSRRALGAIDRLLKPDFTRSQARAALREALARADRRRDPERLFDPSTSLPTRRTTLHLLAEAMARARRESRPLSLTCLWLDGERERFAPCLRSALRRNERCGWLGPQLVGLLVWGHEASADRAGDRLERRLAGEGFSVAAAALQLWPEPFGQQGPAAG